MSQGIKKYKIIIDNIYSEIRKGAGLSKALKTTELFPQNYIEMIKVGEESGNLEGVLSLILESIKESNELKSNIISASVYSAFVLGVALVSFLVIEIYVVPKFKVIFSITGAKIPLITKILLASSDYVGYIFYAIAIALLLILVVLNFMLKKR